jgi:cytochrome c oxidase subunit 2
MRSLPEIQRQLLDPDRSWRVPLTPTGSACTLPPFLRVFEHWSIRLFRPLDAVSREQSILHKTLLAALLTLIAGCSTVEPPEWRTLHPESDFGHLILNVYGDLFWWTAGIFVVVELLLVYALLRFRSRRTDSEVPEQVHGFTALEIGWTLLPAAILFFIAIPTVRTIFQLQGPPPGGDPLEITVIGHQWWWEFQYPELGIVTANELHVPVGRTANLALSSADVIHSFWVPQLGGKRDLNPGSENRLWFTPTKTGVYHGQCAELCGTSHANMRMRVFVDDSATFAEWTTSMREPATPDSAGAMAFLMSGCAACHAIAGTPAQGKVGPNLTNVGRRTTLAASMIPNTPEKMADWLRAPDSVKPGALMPDLNLDEQRIRDLVQFLEGLR